MSISPTTAGIAAGIGVGAFATAVNGYLTRDMWNSDDPSSVILPTSSFVIPGMALALIGGIGTKMGGGTLAAAALGAGIGSVIGGIAGVAIGTSGGKGEEIAPGPTFNPLRPFEGDPRLY